MTPKKTSEIFNALKTELGMDHFTEILANLSLNLSEDGKSLFDVERRESMTGTKMRYPLGWFFERIEITFFVLLLMKYHLCIFCSQGSRTLGIMKHIA